MILLKFAARQQSAQSCRPSYLANKGNRRKDGAIVLIYGYCHLGQSPDRRCTWVHDGYGLGYVPVSWHQLQLSLPQYIAQGLQ